MILAVLARRLGDPELEDDGPFRRLFEEHAPYAFRCLRRLGVAPADLDDVLQEVFLVVLRKSSEVAPAAMRSWIHGICVRKASDYRRGARRRRDRIGGDPAADPVLIEGAAGGDDPELAATRRQALARLDAALDGLSGDERAAFVLYEIEQLSLKEIAAAVRCPVSTVHARLERARDRVARAVREASPRRQT
jgi:RNA polymerase sigma-70 factor (ECF subfamily)